ncbi:protein-S-isoprenylcysteine O-methyltransferase-like [Stylophora pistillata]|uniref:Protein-S-isoprenylcysteine O-methyltransferase n=1 Tax=Stylophora pistillata TaxID=50429 RepID=A0A2B4RBW1_STYPI|nr:protein-S-isoprenylcysteine O-methyltransferase-like [Stylophora pistillata]PFX13868.1 Protein-S-isoprenylcysteine O-methyltransferase [Stylophora pistillata]
MSALNLITEGKVALSYFIACILLVLTLFQSCILTEVWSIASRGMILGFTLFATCFVPYSSVAKRAALLGIIFGIAILLSLGESPWKYFGWYLAALSFFHLSEYIMVARYSPAKLSVDSFLLNHSPEYQIAAVASWIEFGIELWLFPWMKNIFIASLIGFLCMIGGEPLRKLAMITAESNFTHIVQTRKEKSHVLVTHGIYSLCRHPGYAGWFWWSLGTQLTLCNPICLMGYIWASWRFFSERVYDEEITLIYFFGEEYVAYQKKVTSRGVPFVKGFDYNPDMVNNS